MSNDSGDVGAFLAGFVIGALVGAATALILAPQSGSQTRSLLTSRGENLRASGSERWSQVSAALADARSRTEGEGAAQGLPRILLNRDRDQAPPAGMTGKEETPGPEAEGDAPDGG